MKSADDLFANHEWALLIVLLVECAIFSVTGDNFFTAANAFEITRLSVEIGLLALALTPVIITGGIDLSVGKLSALVGTVAVWVLTQTQFGLAGAIAAGFFVAAVFGIFNGALAGITRIPAFIVTLATMQIALGLALRSRWVGYRLGH